MGDKIIFFTAVFLVLTGLIVVTYYEKKFITKTVPVATSTLTPTTSPLSETIIVRRRTGLNQFIDPSTPSETSSNTLSTFLGELQSETKASAFRIVYNDWLAKTPGYDDQIKQAIETTVSKNKIIIIAFNTFVHTDEAYDATSKALNNILLEIPNKQYVIVNVFNEAGLFNAFGSWETCPPVSPIMKSFGSQETMDYLDKIYRKASIARANIDPSVKFIANDGYVYRPRFLAHCPEWASITEETMLRALSRYHLFFDKLNNLLDYVGFNYYPLEREEHWVTQIANDFTRRYDKPIIITETGMTTSDEVERTKKITAEFTALASIPTIPLVLVYYDVAGDDGYGIKNIDRSPRPAYGAIPSVVDILTDTKPTWCKNTYFDSVASVSLPICDILHNL